jgi:hypothetical protein
MSWREVMTMVRGQTANTRLTVDLGSAALYRSVKVAAAYQGRPVRDVVAEALRDWLEKQEELGELGDLVDIAAVRNQLLSSPKEAGRETPGTGNDATHY